MNKKINKNIIVFELGVSFLIISMLYIWFNFYIQNDSDDTHMQNQHTEIEDKINAANYCEVSADCVEVYDSNLTFSCEGLKFVNKEEIENINEEIKQFELSQPFGKIYCNTIRDPSVVAFSICENSKCVEGYPLTSDYGKSCTNDSECEGFCVIENKKEVRDAYNKYFLNKKDPIMLGDFEEVGVKVKLSCSKNVGNYSCYPKFEKGEFKNGWSKSDCVE